MRRKVTEDEYLLRAGWIIKGKDLPEMDMVVRKYSHVGFRRKGEDKANAKKANQLACAGRPLRMRKHAGVMSVVT